MVEILPSILSADFARLGEEVAALERAGCGMFHVDVMDGHFVPNITIGPPVVESLRKATASTLDVHLMIADPDRYIAAFVAAGADQLSVHQETCPHLDRTLHAIREEGAKSGRELKAGAVINPSTPVRILDDVLPIADFVLVMSVNPGFGGQRFIPNALNKVRQLSARRKELGLHFAIEIDGGLTLDNVTDVVYAGVDWIVAGSAIFHSVNPADAFTRMRQAAREATLVRV
jgi:ribulose-phosphate 3-epimerase